MTLERETGGENHGGVIRYIYFVQQGLLGRPFTKGPRKKDVIWDGLGRGGCRGWLCCGGGGSGGGLIRSEAYGASGAGK